MDDDFIFKPLVFNAIKLVAGRLADICIRGYSNDTWAWIVTVDDGFIGRCGEVGVEGSSETAMDTAVEAAADLLAM